jgi:hypothetical protein
MLGGIGFPRILNVPNKNDSVPNKNDGVLTEQKRN